MIGDKIKYWCVKNYGSINKAADALETPIPTLHRYISGENMPGAPFLIKMRKAGANINWLIDKDIEGSQTSEYSDELKFKYDQLMSENSKLKLLLSKIDQLLKQELH